MARSVGMIASWLAHLHCSESIYVPRSKDMLGLVDGHGPMTTRACVSCQPWPSQVAFPL